MNSYLLLLEAQSVLMRATTTEQGLQFGLGMVRWARRKFYLLPSKRRQGEAQLEEL